MTTMNLKVTILKVITSYYYVLFSTGPNPASGFDNELFKAMAKRRKHMAEGKSYCRILILKGTYNNSTMFFFNLICLRNNIGGSVHFKIKNMDNNFNFECNVFFLI